MDVMSSRSSATELEHDFLWRTKRDLPKRGRFGIFNRPYYEEVLIVRVHRGILNSEDIPDAPHHYGKLWHDRYRSIRDLEAVSKRVRHDRVRGWAARPNRDSSRLQHTGRGLDVEPGHPSAA